MPTEGISWRPQKHSSSSSWRKWTKRNHCISRRKNSGNRFAHHEEKSACFGDWEPEKIANLYSKWVKDLEDMKNKNKDYSCPIKNVSIHFIYIDKVYKLTPDAFSSDYMTRYYFEDAHEIIEKDLQDAGCIYTHYWGDLD